MRKSFLAVLFICAAAVLFSAPKPASADIYFSLANSTGKTFTEIWVEPASNGRWLPRDKFQNSDGTATRLRSGYRVTLWPNMNGRQNIRYWDIKVVTSDGRKHEYRNIDMYVVEEIEIDRYYTPHYLR